MNYRALITMDWGKPHSPNDQQRLMSALMDAGWRLAETTAFTIETPDLGRIWLGIELVAKGSGAAGTLTALTFNLVGSDDFSVSRRYPARKNHPSALDKIAGLPLPKPKP